MNLSIIRCGIIENFQGKNVLDTWSNIGTPKKTLEKAWMIRGNQCCHIHAYASNEGITKTFNKTIDSIIPGKWQEPFVNGTFLILYSTKSGKITFRVNNVNCSKAFSASTTPFLVSVGSFQTSYPLDSVSITLDTAGEVFLQDIFFESTEPLILPNITRLDDSIGIRYSDSDIPGLYGQIFQMTEATGLEFSIETMLDEDPGTTSTYRKLLSLQHEKIPVIIRISGFAMIFNYPVTLRGYDSRRVVGSVRKARLRLEFKEYTEVDI